MEISLGPILFEWKREDVLAFYEEAAKMDVDTVYLGEVVCAKKLGLSVKDIAGVANMLTEAGKKVVLSSLAVVSNEKELGLVRALVGLPYAIEANDMSVFNMVDPLKREVYCGPHITTYNAPSIEFLKGLGVRRVCFPVELPAEAVAYNIKETGIEAEVFAWGRVPLAFSWRCYTSRAHGLLKTNCRHNCADNPGGIMIRTMEGEPIFTINGTSILSAATLSLSGETEDLGAMGVKALRISPQFEGTGEVVRVFRERLNKDISADEAAARLKGLALDGGVVNGWYHGLAGKDLVQVEAG